MLFRRETLEGIARGEIDRAFRRWKRPGAKIGGRVRTAAGVVRIGEVETIDPDVLTNKDATQAGFADLAALFEMLGPQDGNLVYRIALEGIEADERVELRKQNGLSDADWRTVEAQFERWDRSRPGYFLSILKAIGDRPAIAAATLAADAGIEKLKFKQDVRKLEELGLTESLDVGYRLSPRGEAVLARLGAL